MNSYPDQATHHLRHAILLSLKIGVGSALAIYAAAWAGLENPASAGTITLLTLITSMKGTFRLIVRRYTTFLATLILCVLITRFIPNQWIAFSIFLILITFLIEILDWEATLSVNALVGIHFIQQGILTPAFVQNEFFLLTIGVVPALVLNLYNSQESTTTHLYQCIKYTELEMQARLKEVDRYIHSERHVHPFRKLEDLDKELDLFIRQAEKYKEDTFDKGNACFEKYFAMRKKQCAVLTNLHFEIRKIRSMPDQAETVAAYILVLADHVRDHNQPGKQLEQLYTLIESLQDNWQFSSRQEFEDQAMLYHILMDLEAFLLEKARFLDQLDPDEQAVYYALSVHETE